jgi:hypothetical protein
MSFWKSAAPLDAGTSQKAVETRTGKNVTEWGHARVSETRDASEGGECKRGTDLET